MVKPRGDGPEGFPECPGSGGVEHEEDDGGALDGAVGAVDADGLDGTWLRSANSTSSSLKSSSSSISDTMSTICERISCSSEE